MFGLMEGGANITMCVSAGGHALLSNEYELLVQQKPHEDAPPVASNRWCVLTVLCLVDLLIGASSYG
uniref:Uncharacterized protein n=1 Tax=Arundo donax TaxID=35708 RepID=A0A0A9CYA1_ARUDO